MYLKGSRSTSVVSESSATGASSAETCLGFRERRSYGYGSVFAARHGRPLARPGGLGRPAVSRGDQGPSPGAAGGATSAGRRGRFLTPRPPFVVRLDVVRRHASRVLAFREQLGLTALRGRYPHRPAHLRGQPCPAA